MSTSNAEFELAPSWHHVQRIQLIRREIRESLSPCALEALFDRAEKIVEGGVDEGRPSRAYATVMVTIDLGACRDMFRERVDAATAQRVAELVSESAWVNRRLAELASPELARLGGSSEGSVKPQLEHKARAEGCLVLIDGDAMAAISREAVR